MENRNIFSKHSFVADKNERGNLIITLLDFYPRKNKEYYDIFVEHIVKLTHEAVEISKKYKKDTIYVHIDLQNCSMKNFSFTFFKKINSKLADEFHDILKKMYIYSNSKIFKILWKLVKNFIDPDTKERIKFVKS